MPFICIVKLHTSLSKKLNKFPEKLFTEIWADTCGKTHGRTEMVKLVGAFRENAKAPNKFKSYITEKGARKS